MPDQAAAMGQPQIVRRVVAAMSSSHRTPKPCAMRPKRFFVATDCERDVEFEFSGHADHGLRHHPVRQER